MVYDTKNRLLSNGIKLSNRDNRLLILLSNNTLVRYEEMAEYLYNDNFESKGIAIRVLLKRFRDKTKLNVITKKTLGYVLKDEIYFK